MMDMTAFAQAQRAIQPGATPCSFTMRGTQILFGLRFDWRRFL